MTAEPRPGRGSAGVAARFAAVVAAQPHAPAVSDHERVWSYRQVADHAAGIAHVFDEVGVCPGEVVAVIADRSVTRVAAWLAILARRAVVLPLDPATPMARQQPMLARTDAAWVLAVGSVTVPAGARVIPVPEADRVAPETTLRVASPCESEPGYVVFTSGSTGTPKAILGRSDSLAHFLDWQRRQFSVGPGDRVAHLASPEFDAALREVLLPLTSGAVLCLPPRGPLAPERVLAWLAERRVTVVHTVPTVARAWLSATSADLRLPDLRVVLFSGEPLPEGLVRRWRERLAYAGEIINLYGPTETTMIRCWHRVSDPAEPGIQPLGRPIADSQVWVRHLGGDTAKPGEVGEILIRTAFGTHGYLGATPEDTARFTTSPDRPGEVVYRTGDRGHVDSDGVLHYDGRADDQVKIHGVRLHLRAIEAAVEDQSGIQQAAVIAEPGVDDAPCRLIAYLVLDSGQSTIPAGLRGRLRQLLPLAAIPAVFIPVAALPRTAASGKLDHRRLTAAPVTGHPTTDHKGQ